MYAEPPIEGQLMPLQGARHELQVFAWISLIAAAVLAVYASTTWSMIEIWTRSETFAHGFLVVPAFLYLVWKRRGTLAVTEIRLFWPGLLLVLGIGFVWLLAQLAGTLGPAQVAVVALIPAAILTLWGWLWLRVLAFPCAFLFFAVPFGEVFVPSLIEWTANFTVAGLRLSGVPVYREGAFFVIPTGQWSVVDACSGIRYLIASTMSGALFAWLMYRSPVRRALFMVVAILLPLLANWIRAYGIVMLGHLSNNRLAGGVDHLIYGWIFFGFVMFAMFAIGARWREAISSGDTGRFRERDERGKVTAPGARVVPNKALIAALALSVVAWPLARLELQQPFAEAAPPLPLVAPANGWRPTEPFSKWSATMQAPAERQTAYFFKSGHAVGVQVGVYRAQSQGAELVTSANTLVDGAEKGGRLVRQSIVTDASALTVRESMLQVDGRLLVHDWYWLDDRTTVSGVEAKLRLALDRLLRRDDTSAWVLLFTPVETDENAARAVLEQFKKEMGASVETALRASLPRRGLGSQ